MSARIVERCNEEVVVNIKAHQTTALKESVVLRVRGRERLFKCNAEQS